MLHLFSTDNSKHIHIAPKVMMIVGDNNWSLDDVLPYNAFPYTYKTSVLVRLGCSKCINWINDEKMVLPLTDLGHFGINRSDRRHLSNSSRKYTDKLMGLMEPAMSRAPFNRDEWNLSCIILKRVGFPTIPPKGARLYTTFIRPHIICAGKRCHRIQRKNAGLVSANAYVSNAR